MNLNFLVESILPQRKKEFAEEKNLSTRHPMYVVLDLADHYCEGHSDFISHSTNYAGKDKEWGYIDMNKDAEDREFNLYPDGMTYPVKVTQFFTDRVIAFFLTSQSAHDYLQYQKHNLSDPYVYVFHTGYRNWEMDNLFENER
jgi:hypothetical protein